MSANRLTLTEASLGSPSTDKVSVQINGVDITVPKGENIIEAAKRAGIDIPFFCYHARLSRGDAANCRMCLVEVATKGPDGSLRKMPKPQTACTLPAIEGLIIETETEALKADRRGILEFLLINHPLDCPICDRGGECPLQNNTLFYGPPTTRFIEEKRHFVKAYPLSKHVVFDRERCIHCARCTRFTTDISGDGQLGFLKRSADMEVGTFAHTEYQSRFSGNVIELCPVGALLSREYRFKARPWDLFTQKSICSRCSNGCNIRLDYRAESLERVNARLNEDVNEEWTCDRGKFGHAYVSDGARLKSPMVRRGGQWVEVDWSAAYALLSSKLREAGQAVGAIGGARCTNEDNYALQKLFRDVLKSSNLDHRLGRNQGAVSNALYRRLGYHTMGNSIAELEGMKSILVLGADLADEQPIIFLRIRKAWRFRNAHIVSAICSQLSEGTHVGDFADVELRYKPGTEVALLGGLLHSILSDSLPLAETPGIAGLKAGAARWTPEQTASETGVSADAIQKAARLLAGGAMAIVAGKAVADHQDYDKVADAIADLAIATGNAANVNVPGSQCNTQGALDLGVVPDSLPGYRADSAPGLNTDQMLSAAERGELKALWLVGADLLERYHDPELARRALERCPFVVVNELRMTETAKMANLVLPVASMAEKDGTYTNCERRVQRLHKAFELSDQIKPDWLVFTEVADLLGGGANCFSARDIFREIAKTVPGYEGMSLKALGETGLRWDYARPVAPPAAPVEPRFTPQAP